MQSMFPNSNLTASPSTGTPDGIQFDAVSQWLGPLLSVTVASVKLSEPEPVKLAPSPVNVTSVAARLPANSTV